MMDFWANLRKVQWHISECCDLGAFCEFFRVRGRRFAPPLIIFWANLMGSYSPLGTMRLTSGISRKTKAKASPVSPKTMTIQ